MSEVKNSKSEGMDNLRERLDRIKQFATDIAKFSYSIKSKISGAEPSMNCEKDKYNDSAHGMISEVTDILNQVARTLSQLDNEV